MSALANALQTCAPSPTTLAAIAAQARVSPRQVSMARAGKPISAGAYLALCGAANVDPINGTARPTKFVSADVVWWLLSAALYITRDLRRLDQRGAAKVIGVSSSTVCRLESGKPVSVANMIKVCAFIGVHPDGYTAPLNCPCGLASPRETGTATSCSDLDFCRGSRAAHA